MQAMRLHHVREPLRLDDIATPSPGPGEVLIEVAACGVCRTDLHIIDGDLPPHRMPLVPGHEIVGRVSALGPEVERLSLGQRVGVPWLGGTCGRCPYCRAGQENLCDAPTFTGYDVDGGYAAFACARADFCIVLPDEGDDAATAPLLCAGLIGFRSYRKAGEVRRLGLVGFGAAAHIITQLALADGVEVFALTRPGDAQSQGFARSLGAVWAGGTDEMPPEPLDAAIVFAPVGALVPRCLRLVRKGGRVVCAGIHMSDIPGFPYRDLWEERQILSVANLTREDGRDFFERLRTARLRARVRRYPLALANEAIGDARAGRIDGAAVLVP